ncbi:MAG: AmmeMemoRadiSam system protein B [Candidatus Coatesbacteria bacterium]|nr:MAG: AmmeMemoRadiSam system protein B [Candidatus Coatesbacteria bacterium]
MIRRPAVAGQFYERTSSGLREQVRLYVEDVPQKVPAKAIMCPHAGYVCSGPVAGKVYSRIPNYDTYVILGPNHTGAGAPVAVFGEGSWSMPMGEVPIDEELASAIVSRSSAARLDEAAHHSEHCLEVQLPFIQFFNKSFSIVPICIGLYDFRIADRLGKELADVITASAKSVLIIASTDMSHYIPHEVAVKLDRLAIDRVLALDAQGLYDVVASNSISMCGVIPTVAAISAANALGASSATLVSYRTSGETCSNKAQVVGYAGVIIQ